MSKSASLLKLSDGQNCKVPSDLSFQGYYKRTAEYLPILRRHVDVCQPVAMVHSAVLINLQHQGSELLRYHPPPPGYDGPHDDIIIFAHSAKYHRVPMHILNRDFYGYMQVPMEAQNSLSQEQEQLAHILNTAMSECWSGRTRRAAQVCQV